MTRMKTPPAKKPLAPVWPIAGIVFICILTYANSLSGAFVWDDELQIVKNPEIRSLSNIPADFTHPFWGFLSPQESRPTNFYRPVQTILYSIGYWLGPLSPTPDHWISLALHATACVFLYLILIQLAISRTISWIVAALFAVHPVHTEAVAWIAGVTDLACGAFYFAALWAFLNFCARMRWTWLVGSSVLYFVALMAKEMAITLPLLILLLTFHGGSRITTAAKKLTTITPYLGVTALYLIMRVHALGFFATTHARVDASWLDWITLGFLVFGQYIWYSLIPYPLISYHLIAVHLADRAGPTALAMLLIAVLAATAWRLRAKLPDLWFWLVAFAILLMPVFYFKGISAAFFAERYLYIPGLAVSVVLATLFSRVPLRWTWYLGGGVIALFAMMSFARNQDWASDETLYTKDLQTDPNIAHFQVNLAGILMARGDDAGTRLHLEAAARALDNRAFIQQDYERYRTEVGLGALDARARNYVSARAHLERALQMYPQGDWGYLYLGGIALEADHDYAKAVEDFDKAISIDPTNEVARDYLGIAMLNQGKVKEAIDAFQKALEINPTDEDARKHLAVAMQSPARSGN